jgi:hypothetical protein
MRRPLLAILTCVLIAAPAQEAFGQCTISTLEINGVVTLCADGGDAWEWTGPGGFTSSAMCVDALVDGTYSLRTFDAVAGTWSQPCTQVVGDPSTGPACGIAGPDTTCFGTAATWCGPEGDLAYDWTGPGGFAAATSCIQVSVAGTYTLKLTDRTSGATGDPCTKTLFVSDCAPPPPPPAPGDTCPASARWWSRTCPGPDAELFARLATLVDQRSNVWSFEGRVEGLCELFHNRRLGGTHRAARRQFAAVHANLAARELGLRDPGGQTIGLNPDATLDHVPGVAAGTRLRDWVASTEATLCAIGSDSRPSRSARQECRRIRQQARAINAGVRDRICFRTQGTWRDDDDDDDDLEASEPGAEFSSAPTGTNPFGGMNRMRWSLQRAGEVQLDVLDLSGRRVRRLAQGVFGPGTHELTWDGRDDGGRLVRPGAYFVAGRVLDLRVGQRLILLR